MYVLNVSITMHSSDGRSKFRYFITIFYLADRSVPQAAIKIFKNVNNLHIVEDDFFLSTNYIIQKNIFSQKLDFSLSNIFCFQVKEVPSFTVLNYRLKVENMQNHLISLIFSHINNENHLSHMFEAQSV